MGGLTAVESLGEGSSTDGRGFGVELQREPGHPADKADGSLEAIDKGGAKESGGGVNMCTKVPSVENHRDVVIEHGPLICFEGSAIRGGGGECVSCRERPLHPSLEERHGWC